MKDLTDFLTLVQPYAIAAPEPVITRCIRDAAIRFCERTRMWRTDDAIETDGIYPEPITVLPDSVLFEIAKCSIDGIPLDPISIDDLADLRPNWRTETPGSGAAKYYVSPELGTVQCVPLASGIITVEAIVKPKANAKKLPDFLYDLYSVEIGKGAAGRVLRMPGEAFTNPQYGAVLEGEFELRLHALADEGRRGQQRARRRTRASFF